MLNGFEFRSDDKVYFVCSADLARARLILANHDRDASMMPAPETLPDTVLRYLGLKDGELIVGRFIRKGSG
ncbi:MAG TPA: hypothetical protein P5114_09360 [Hyphomicrobiaceae bacterium]|nr:hypothetical protein [Hyphomicrobiaceae bacterium]